MKKFLTITFLLAGFALTANAQCDTDEQRALYAKFVADHKGTPEQRKAASLAAKDYLSKYAECSTEAEKKITIFVKDWLVKYEVAIDESKGTTAVQKTPAQAFELCRPYLARDPESLRAHLLLSAAGLSSRDKNLKGETVRVARKSLDLIRSGSTVTTWVIGNNKDEAVATLEFYSASLAADTTPPAEMAATMLKFAKSTTPYSKDPNTYLYLGRALYESELKKLVENYKLTCDGKPPTPECDAAYATIGTTADRVIDAYARAVALSGTNPEYAAIVTAAKAPLTELYKTRNNDSDTGLDQYIAGVLSKPIP